MTQEIPLTGGRITAGVVRVGNTVHRPPCANGDFVHSVLRHLEENNVDCAPRYFGWDEQGREVLSFMPGNVPADLGLFTDEQCVCAAGIIRRLHDALKGHPACGKGQTVCHNDLSPCNFVFQNDLPCAVIDWDAAAIGDAQDDLAYAAWMWLDIGNPEQDAAEVRHRITLMLDAYGLRDRADFVQRMLRQMRRVGSSVFPTPEQTAVVQGWTQQCIRWAETALSDVRL